MPDGPYVAVALIGTAVGLGELISRYKDRPRDIFGFVSTYLYATVNAVASVAALSLVQAFDWSFGLEPTQKAAIGWVQVAVAGTSAMAVLRSSVARVRVHGVDVAIGPQAFLDGLLITTDRGVDRARAKNRDAEISPIMDGLDFDAVARILPPYCFQLLQNSTPEEEKVIADAVRKLAEDDLPDLVKNRILGLQLMVVVGPQVLKEAVISLGDTLTTPDQATLSTDPSMEEAIALWATTRYSRRGLMRRLRK